MNKRESAVYPKSFGLWILLIGTIICTFSPMWIRALAQTPAAPSAVDNIRTKSAAEPANECEPTTVATIRPNRPDWMARHGRVLEQIRQRPVDLVFLGDSIMNNFEKAKPNPDENYAPIWKEFYANRHAINMGFSGDRTENVLWRLQHGEVDGITPKVVVMMIGTNNTHQECSKWYDVLAGEAAIVDELHDRLPETKILLLGIFASNVNARKSEEDRRVNESLGRLYAHSDFVTYLDLRDIFMKDGKFDESLFYDPRPNGQAAHELHPNATGQRKWVEAIEPILASMLGETSHPTESAQLSRSVQAVVPPWAKRKDAAPLALYDEHAAPVTPPPAGLYVAMGDSITFGYGTSNPCQAFPPHPVDIESSCPDGTSYAVRVAQKLRTTGIAGHFMNLGINGARIKTIQEDELPYLPTDATLITIYVGTNDSRAVVNPEVSEDEVVDRYKEQFEELLTSIRARAPRAKIVLINFPNQKYLAAGYHVPPEVLPRYDAVSQRLASFLDSYYPNYPVVDTICMPESYQESMLYKASVHPNDNGSKKLADMVVKTILSANPPAPSKSCRWFDSASIQ